MLDVVQGLPASALPALADLERRTVAVDGGRLKLEMHVLQRGGTDAVLWWDGDRLVGFLGLYAFGGAPIELVGMVDPADRRQGIGRALLDAAMGRCREREASTALLVCPRASVGGAALAATVGGRLEHSEYALQLLGDPTDGPHDASLALRPMVLADVDERQRILTAAFDWAPSDPRAELEDTVTVERAGAVVGTLRLERSGPSVGIYGFAVDPALQGRGIGRDVLRRVCRQARADGATRVRLEVAVDNERALGLYTSVGFTEVTTEDYYALPL